MDEISVIKRRAKFAEEVGLISQVSRSLPVTPGSVVPPALTNGWFQPSAIHGLIVLAVFTERAALLLTLPPLNRGTEMDSAGQQQTSY